MSAIYDDVLVISAPHGSPTPSCGTYFHRLQSLGAHVYNSTCHAEVGLTRCLQAASAYQLFQSNERLNWLFWVDGDMVADPRALQALILISERIEAMSGQYATVSGAYVNRHDIEHNVRLAAHAVKRSFSFEVNLAPNPADLLERCVYHATLALCGMGCLLQHRSTFMQHCDESEHFCYPNEEYLIPLVCQSTRIHASELAEFLHVDASKDLWYWNNEDFDYSMRELSKGRCVYLVDVPFGHEFARVTFPDRNTVFPGLLPPEDD